jgi:hypothetical protein
MTAFIDANPRVWRSNAKHVSRRDSLLFRKSQSQLSFLRDEILQRQEDYDFAVTRALASWLNNNMNPEVAGCCWLVGGWSSSRQLLLLSCDDSVPHERLGTIQDTNTV